MSKIKSVLLIAGLCLAFMATPAVAANASLADLFEEVSPSVVIIHTFKRSRESLDTEVDFSDPAGLGSGVLVSPGGLVITASHVVQIADAIRVEFQDGTQVNARVVSSEPAADVAMLKLERVPENAIVVAMGDSDTVRVGENVFVIGAPYGEGHTLTVGYISARRSSDRGVDGIALGEFFQTDAAINKGNSGGPLFNTEGEVIGIVSHIRSTSGGSEGLGFAVTINTVKAILLEEKTIWTGIDGVGLGPGMLAALNVPAKGGFLIQRIADNSPAAKLRLRGGTVRAVVRGEKILLGGDIILSVQDIPVGIKGSYIRIQKALAGLRSKKDGVMKVTVLRAGKRMSFERRIGH